MWRAVRSNLREGRGHEPGLLCTLMLAGGDRLLQATLPYCEPSFIGQNHCRADHKVFKIGKNPSDGKGKRVTVGVTSDTF